MKWQIDGAIGPLPVDVRLELFGREKASTAKISRARFPGPGHPSQFRELPFEIFEAGSKNCLMRALSGVFEIAKHSRALQQEAINLSLLRDFVGTQPGRRLLAILGGLDLILYGFAFPTSRHHFSIRATSGRH
jgi:hypothetical protein